MKTISSDLRSLLRTMSPVRNPGVYAFSAIPSDSTIEMGSVVASIREREGLSIILPEADATRLGLPILFRSAWLTLEVQSDLGAVGFAAAFSAALGQAGISCNIVAGAQHDHVFVPYEQADAAMAALVQLQQASA